MSIVKVQGNASGTGIFTIAAPNSNTDRTLTLPDSTGTVVTSDASGNVGIGTSSPVSRLNVSVTDGGSVTISNTNDTHTGALNFGDTSSNTSGRISYDHSSNALRFDSNGSERARIDSSGNLLVGTTTSPTTGGVGAGFIRNASVSGSYTLAFRTNVSTDYEPLYFYNGNGFVGYIRTNGSSTSYVTSSDYRLKEDVQPMTGALAKVASLKPCIYKWKADGSSGQGFIAHELAEVVPDAVTGEKDAVNEDGSIKPQGIDTSFLVATLTAAIQEQQALIESLTARIAALEGTSNGGAE